MVQQNEMREGAWVDVYPVNRKLSVLDSEAKILLNPELEKFCSTKEECDKFCSENPENEACQKIMGGEKGFETPELSMPFDYNSISPNVPEQKKTNYLTGSYPPTTPFFDITICHN